MQKVRVRVCFVSDSFVLCGNPKALNTEIKAKRETVESVLSDNETCVNSIKVSRLIQLIKTASFTVSYFGFLQDYETDLASYTSGLETLLNVPIKRTMLKSPSMDLNQEVTFYFGRWKSNLFFPRMK